VVEGAEVHEDGRAGRAAEVSAWGMVEAPEAEVSQWSRRPERWVGDHGSPQGASASVDNTIAPARWS
jgi:hypothetical protein